MHKSFFPKEHAFPDWDGKQDGDCFAEMLYDD